MAPETPLKADSWRAWCFLVWLSFQRQARAHLMVWIALGLLGLSLLIVGIQTQAGRWTMAGWSHPRGKGVSHAQHVDHVGFAGMLPWHEPQASVHAMVHGGYYAAVHEATGFFVFSDLIAFSLFTTFLLPLWCIAFATEGLGRERESQNLLWVLTRPIPRPAIFLAKYLALLPWCLVLNVGGFALLCLAGGRHGRLAFEVYWPAAFWGTLAFSAIFHMMAACLRRAAILALLYAFFLETLMGNMPGQFKRLSISFYTRCLMFDRAHEYGIHPERPLIFLPVGGTTAWLVLAGVTVLCLVVGAIVFTRNEYLDVN
ncbi:MAG: ABC transporter permease [Gemmataceae bacterium]|nr:ABC transporter permease [Gemmataceae bacterium]